MSFPYSTSLAQSAFPGPVLIQYWGSGALYG
jgi:hypothetical protein